MHPYLVSLCQEYVELVDNMRSGSFTLAEIRELDSQRQNTHYELCRITGKSHDEDMYTYARAIMLAARGGNYQ
jgi:hypothetical protein